MSELIAPFADGELLTVELIRNGERSLIGGVARWQADGSIWVEVNLPPGGCHVDVEHLRIADGAS